MNEPLSLHADVWIVVIFIAFAISAIPYLFLCCCFCRINNKQVWISWIGSTICVGILWHIVGYEWRSNRYWGDSNNGEVKGFSPWTSTYTTSQNTLLIVPNNEEELRQAVLAHATTGGYGPLRVVGSGHSWSPTGYTDGVIIDIRNLNRIVEFSESLVTVEAGAKIQDVVQYLFARGFCLHGIGSIRAQAVGGVVSQGVHGPHPDGLNRHVTAMLVLLANGEFKHLSSEEDLFMWRSSLGLLGVIVQVTFEIFPIEWLQFERSAIKGFSDLRDLKGHLDVNGGTATTFTAFLYPTSLWCSRNIGWKRVGHFITTDASSQEQQGKILKNQTDFESRLMLHFNDHMHPAMQYMSNGFLGSVLGCIEQVLADAGHSLLLSGPSTDVLPNDGLIPQYYEIIDYEYMIPLWNCEIFARELMIEQKFGRVLIPICLRLMRSELSCLSIAHEDSCVFGIESMRGMAYSLDVMAIELRVAELGGLAHLGKVAPGNFRSYHYPCLERFKALRQKLDPHNVFLTPFFANMLLQSNASFPDITMEFEPVVKSRNLSLMKSILFSLFSWILIAIALFYAHQSLYRQQMSESKDSYYHLLLNNVKNGRGI